MKQDELFLKIERLKILLQIIKNDRENNLETVDEAIVMCDQVLDEYVENQQTNPVSLNVNDIGK